MRWNCCRRRPSFVSRLKAMEARKSEGAWWHITLDSDDLEEVPRNIRALDKAFPQWIVTHDKYETALRFRRDEN